jgi:hypothetical protein
MSWIDRSRNWTPPTLRETVAAMQENINASAREEANAHAAVQRFNPGDERLRKALVDVDRCRCEQQHWRRHLEYWKGLLARFPELAEKPSADAARADYARPVRRKDNVIPMPAAPHWSEREREPGEDDLGALPF